MPGLFRREARANAPRASADPLSCEVYGFTPQGIAPSKLHEGALIDAAQLAADEHIRPLSDLADSLSTHAFLSASSPPPPTPPSLVTSLPPSLLSTPALSHAPSPLVDDPNEVPVKVEEDDDDDEEYLPASSRSQPSSKSRKQPRSLHKTALTKRTSRKTARSSPYPTPTASGWGTCPEAAPKLVTFQRRNRQVSPAAGAPIPRDPRNPWKCPYCTYVQGGNRSPDLERHIKTHNASGEDWVCCGVPIDVAAEYGITAGDRPVREYAGQQTVGGCFKGFSRKDALRRHLRKARCAGDANAMWLVGNQQVKETRKKDKGKGRA
ncbi:hypothetical protein BV20DRAFT_558797 [Pilatotrama ljubarskyi]|nr:hypothetical protein BV20DRAFT_558797 [Pilatotrama ljubarskyi]